MGGSVRELDDEAVEDLHGWMTDAFENTAEEESRSGSEQQTETDSSDRTLPVTTSVPSEQASLGAFESSD